MQHKDVSLIVCGFCNDFAMMLTMPLIFEISILFTKALHSILQMHTYALSFKVGNICCAYTFA